MERLSYFIRRLLLVIPTFLGITFLVFGLTQFIMTVEQQLAAIRGFGGGEAGGGATGGVSISEDQRKAIEKEFGFDKPFLERYWTWLVPDAMGMKSYKYMQQQTSPGLIENGFRFHSRLGFRDLFSPT